MAGTGSTAVGLCACCACASSTVAFAGKPFFTDQTVSSHLIAHHRPVYVGSMLAGGAVGDFDNDGDQDVFFPCGGEIADQLFVNNGDGTFTERADEWHVNVQHRGTSAAVADYDGDGWLDVFVTSLGPLAANAAGYHLLYHNNGNGSFSEVGALAGVNRTSSTDPDGYSASWSDYDRDGDLDLAVAAYGDTSGGMPQGSEDGNKLFRNDGDGTFTDVTDDVGLDTLAGIHGFLPRFVDMDGDLYPEIIWVGDFGTSRYYANNGDGTFTDFTEKSGTGVGTTEMGIAIGDFNEDGMFDAYVTTVNDNPLYINLGGNVFDEVAEPAGVDFAGFGWGTVAIDFDHDTLQDLVVTTMTGGQWAFRNVTHGTSVGFENVTDDLGIDTLVSGRGLVNVDYDNDGDQDLIFFPFDDTVRVYRNDLTGPDTNWLRVMLDRGDDGTIAPNGVGSRITASVGKRAFVRQIDAGSNYLSQSELSAHFGLADASVIDSLRIDWTNGETTTLTNVPANRTIVVPPGGRTADVNLDGIVGMADVISVIAAWGPCDADCREDLDGDGMVGGSDLGLVIGDWG